MTGISGKFELNGDYGITLRLGYQEEYQIADNTSTLRITSLEVKSSWYYGVTYYLDGTVKVDHAAAVTMQQGVTGNNVYLPALDTYAAVGGPLGQVTVAHLSDGTKTVTLQLSVKGYTQSGGAGSGWSVSGTHTLTLTPIPRATVPAVVPASALLGSPLEIRLESALPRFTHTLRYQFGQAEGLIGEGLGTCVLWTPPVSLAEQLPNAVSGEAVLTCITYDGTAQIGTAQTRLTLTVPESVVPVVTAFTSQRVDNAVPPDWGVYVAGVSQARLRAEAQGAYGAGIAAYRIGSLTGHEVVTPALLPGENTYALTVTDTRGRSAKASLTLTALPYDVPAFAASPELLRCDEAGAERDDGTCLYARIRGKFASLEGRNALTVRVSCGGQTAAVPNGEGRVLFPGLLDAARTFPVTVTLTDSLGSAASFETTLGTAAAALHIRPGGRGAAFGKYAEADGLLEVDWGLKVNGALNAGGNLNVNGNHTVTGNLDVSGELRQRGTGLLNLVYPVGSIYMSVNNVSPQSFLGGTWVRIQDRFLLAAGSSYAAGATGGEASHTLTVSEMPSHSHNYGTWRNCSKVSGANNKMVEASTDVLDNVPGTMAAGGGAAHNNMPPYLAVYMWKRTG